MARWLAITRTYCIIITVFVLLRTLLEALGAPAGLTSEISVTRLLFVIPVFLGLRFGSGELKGLKTMAGASFVVVFWGGLLVMAATAASTLAGLPGHWGHGPLGQHLLGHLAEVVVLTLVATAICWATSRLSRR